MENRATAHHPICRAAQTVVGAVRKICLMNMCRNPRRMWPKQILKTAGEIAPVIVFRNGWTAHARSRQQVLKESMESNADVAQGQPPNANAWKVADRGSKKKVSYGPKDLPSTEIGGMYGA
jgi:hypothetical protein